MLTLVAKYVVVAALGLFAFCGLFAGGSGTALAHHTVDPKIGNGLAWLTVVACPLLAFAAIPLATALEGRMRNIERFGGYSVRFWQVLMALVFVFGLIMGLFLPNGPFVVQ